MEGTARLGGLSSCWVDHGEPSDLCWGQAQHGLSACRAKTRTTGGAEWWTAPFFHRWTEKPWGAGWEGRAELGFLYLGKHRPQLLFNQPRLSQTRGSSAPTCLSVFRTTLGALSEPLSPRGAEWDSPDAGLFLAFKLESPLHVSPNQP